MVEKIEISVTQLAALVQSLTDAQAVLTDVCDGHGVKLDRGFVQRQNLVKDYRRALWRDHRFTKTPLVRLDEQKSPTFVWRGEDHVCVE